MQDAWAVAPDSVPLGTREVQIWRVTLARPQSEVARLKGCLAPDEETRTARFRFAEHRRRYIVSRGVLRAVLGRALSLPATESRFQYGAEGKPALAAKGFEIDKRKITMPDPFKSIGEFKVPVKVHRDVNAEVTVKVVKE